MDELGKHTTERKQWTPKSHMVTPCLGNVQNREVLRAGEGAAGTTHRHKASVLGLEDALDLGRGNGCAQCECTEGCELYSLK